MLSFSEQYLVARRTRKRYPTRQIGARGADGLCRAFTVPARPDVRWCGDLTEIPTHEGKLQLAPVLDLHSGAASGRHGQLPRRGASPRGVVRGDCGARRSGGRGAVYIDQGSEYTANDSWAAWTKVEAARRRCPPPTPRQATGTLSSLIDRYRDRSATDPRPPLTMEPLRPLIDQQHGQPHSAARHTRGAQPTDHYKPVSAVSADCHASKTG